MGLPEIDPAVVGERLAALRRRIREVGVDPDTTTILAVTKGFGPDAVQAALAAGLVDVGENYAQELLSKVESAAAVPPRWHMIGALQRNKVRKLAPHVSVWQTVDRLAVGREIARWAPGATVFVQVNATGEAAKAGCPPDQVPELVEQLHALGLDVRGLMTIGPTEVGADPRPGFEATAALADRLGLAERSMGMSGDLEVGLSCGATMVRVGTALFGPRRQGVTAEPPAGV
ncbi:MAG: YggS family pyridoxal phosphate-dependent enzyme [Acidimicrobiales bacterium]|nr:YggS family pyridoxal phosphate-dependent enzyme [Acidimicrobiales bacterium]